MPLYSNDNQNATFIKISNGKLVIDTAYEPDNKPADNAFYYKAEKGTPKWRQAFSNLIATFQSITVRDSDYGPAFNLRLTDDEGNVFILQVKSDAPHAANIIGSLSYLNSTNDIKISVWGTKIPDSQNVFNNVMVQTLNDKNEWVNVNNHFLIIKKGEPLKYINDFPAPKKTNLSKMEKDILKNERALFLLTYVAENYQATVTPQATKPPVNDPKPVAVPVAAGNDEEELPF